MFGFNKAKVKLVCLSSGGDPSKGASGLVPSLPRVVIGSSSGAQPPCPSEPDGDPAQSVNFKELINLVYFFPDARAESKPTSPSPFIQGVNNPTQDVAPPLLVVFDRLIRVKDDKCEKVSSLAKESKKPLAVLPRRRGSYKICGSDQLSFCPPLNDSLGRITKSRPSSNAAVSIPLEELRRLELAFAGLQEAQSSSFLVRVHSYGIY